MFPILFVFGPSGVGKTTLAEYLANKNDWIHFDIDSPLGDGIDINGFRKEWDDFLHRKSATSFVVKIKEKTGAKKGAIFTFASTSCPDFSYFQIAQSAGIKFRDIGK